MPSAAPTSEQLLGPVVQRAGDYPGANRAPLDYPGSRPVTSYVYLDHLVAPLKDSSRSGVLIGTSSGDLHLDEFLKAHDFVPLSERFAVLAVGSNACPGRLEEKFNGNDHEPVIVLKGWITNVDSIYAGWLADYGALPATIAESPGTDLEVWATLLTRSQLKIMNDSERLDDDYVLVSVTSPLRTGGGKVERIYAYFDRRALVLGGELARVADLSARNAVYRALSEKQALAAVLDQLGFAPGQSIEERHRLLLQNPSPLGTLNARIASSHSGLNSHGQSIVPVPLRELQPMHWIGR
jgi:hypothetical protein